MSNPRDKLENDVYFLKSLQRPWLAIQIGDIVDPVTKARNITVEQIDENNKAQQWRSTFQNVNEFGYGVYTLQSEDEGLTGYYLSTAGTGSEQVLAELTRSEGQNLKWWSGCRNGASESRIFTVADVPVINALSYEGFAGTKVKTVTLPPPAPGAPGGNWGENWNLWTPFKFD